MTTSRRDLIRGLAGSSLAGGAGAAAALGLPWAWVLNGQTARGAQALRPPGALDDADFLARCIKCGQCAIACPYDTLRLADVLDDAPLGTPFFTARDIPCFLCDDIPCVAACPTGALSPDLTDIRDADMGIAVIVDQTNCLSYRGLRCEICYRDCPLQGDAITVETQPRKTSKHAVFIPVVSLEHCTGCGVCEKSCPLPDPAIKVLPRTIGQGALGEHYGFSEDSQPDLTHEFQPAATAPDLARPAEGSGGLDYLNAEDL